MLGGRGGGDESQNSYTMNEECFSEWMDWAREWKIREKGEWVINYLNPHSHTVSR